jgi:hypothetical protein
MLPLMKLIVGENARLLIAIFVATLAVSALTGGDAAAFYLTPIALYALTLIWERFRESRNWTPKGRSGGGRSRGSR